MTASIAILGWGSLLWEGGAEFDRWHDSWRYDGPTLPLEFSRLSTTRNGALTLVIDPENGALVRVAWCRSRRTTIGEAVADLATREGAPKSRVGLIENGRIQCQDQMTGKIVQEWAKASDLTDVVWTDLRSNFSEKLHVPFSIDAAVNYVEGLEGEAHKSAMEYIEHAPHFVRTPVRDALQC